MLDVFGLSFVISLSVVVDLRVVVGLSIFVGLRIVVGLSIVICLLRCIVIWALLFRVPDTFAFMAIEVVYAEEYTILNIFVAQQK